MLARDPLRLFRSLATTPDIAPIGFGRFRALVVTDAELTRDVLVNDQVFDKGGALYDRIREIAGDGLISCGHHRHRRQRRLLQPTFHRERLEAYSRAMSTQTAAATHRWSDGQHLDVFTEMLTLTTRTLVETMLSGALTDAQTHQAVADYTVVVKGLYARAILPTPLTRIPTPGNRRYDQACRRLRSLLTAVVEQSRTLGHDHGDLLSALLAQADDAPAHDSLSDAEICDHLVTFLMAGSETTAVVLAWALHFLSLDAQLEERLHAEVDALGLNGEPASTDHLGRLPLTQKTITEALRFYPPGWVFSRLTTRDTRLGDRPIPAGTTIIYSPYLIHHRPDLYADPERFNPDRWSAGNPHRPPRHAFIPFGAGARKCIGDQFGLIEAGIALATITSRWKFERIARTQADPVAAVSLHPRFLLMKATARAR